ncbi:MAG: M20/M25/M40 family metallo-hydrolase, partial [Lachnospiraceae bacterium]|nr:M20/M25/M40 family metallo-hydrolase [Lachnospiraceae bacterium]
VASHRQDDVRIEVELLGERPCNGDVDEAAEQAIVDRISACIERAWGKEARLHTSSTDSNIPLSLGVPAVTIGGCVCAGAHTREEWMDHTSLLTGMRYLLDVFSYYFEAPDQT